MTDHKQRQSIDRRQLLQIAAASTGAALATGLMPSLALADEAPVKGGILRMAVPGGSTDSLDPHITYAAMSDIIRFSNLFDGLAEYSPDAEVTMVLAEAIEGDSTGTIWTIRLRQGVTFHDGRPLTAADVVFTIKRILDPANNAKGASVIGFIDPAAVETLDDHTLRITLAEPYGPFRELWTNTYLRIVPQNFDPANPVGTGAFRHQSFAPGNQSVFTRFDGYFRGAAHVDELHIININDNSAAINAVRGGQVDITYNVPFAEAKIIEADAALRILDNPNWQFLPIYMRADVAPFTDVRLRQALMLIADRPQLIRSALNGYGSPGNDMLGTYTNCGDEGVGQRAQDIERAMALLAEAGQTGLTLELTTVNATPGMVESAQVYAEQAKAAGVTINVTVLEPDAYLANYTNWPFGIDFNGDSYLALVKLCLLPGGPFNLNRWEDAEFQDLAAQVFRTADDAERCTIINRMRAIEHDRGCNIIWGFTHILNAHSARVHGMRPSRTDTPLGRANEIWLA